MSSTTPVEFRTKMKYTTQAIKLGSSDTLDLVVYEVKHNSKNDARISLSKEAVPHVGRRNGRQGLGNLCS